MPRLSTEKINEIRQSVDIVDVIGQYLPLERKGRNYVTVCPFHDDTHPSMSISPEKQIFMCFVCHHGGNVFTFLQDYLKISYIEAVKMVASMGHVDLGDFANYDHQPKINQELEPFYLMHEEANRIYKHFLTTKVAILAKDYLTDRGITQDIINRFDIGYAPDKNILIDAFEKSGYSKMQAFASGLVIESYSPFDRYKDRIMFPLHNSDGRVVGFSGRIYKKSQDEAKYMNSPESKIFIKGDTLYNYHRVKNIVKDKENIIILEGFMDVIALYKASIENAVAIMGTALTSGHLTLLKRLTKNIVLCLDGDQAGQNAMIKCIDELVLHGFHVSVVVIPDSMDPDEFLNSRGKEELVTLFNRPISSIEFKMNYYYERINTDNYEDRKQYLESMVHLISQLDDEIDKVYYSEQLEKKSGFSKDVIHSLLKKEKMIQPVRINKPITYQSSKKIIDKYQKAERELLYFMMRDKKYAMQYEAKAGYMFDHINRIIASYIVDYYRQYVVLEVADLISQIDDEEIVKTILEIASLNLPDLKDNQAIDDYIRIIQEKMKMERVKQLENDLSHTLDDIQKSKIALEIIQLKREINDSKEKE